MRRFKIMFLPLLALVLVLEGPIAGGAVNPAAAVAAPAAAPVSTAVVAKAASGNGNAPDNYAPKGGVKFNNPLAGPKVRRTINRHILRSINSTKARAKIRIATWNLRSDSIINALIRAHRRGVSVRLIMDAGNANGQNPNDGFALLKEKLSITPKERPAHRRSWARRCKGSCRGPSGIAHTKMFLFSEVGGVKNVSMYGSHNATDLAASHQWNDIYTVVRRPGIHDRLNEVFHEMAQDKTAKQPYVTYKASPFLLEVLPYAGKNTKGDPVMRELGKVTCRGARGGTGINGRTALRIAMTSWHGQRGIKIANRVRKLWNNGCNIRIVYAVMGNNVLDVIRSRAGRGGIPLRQITQDFNEDGVYDRYLHMKVLTISGVYGNNRRAAVTWNGSANWAPVSLNSDEVGMKITKPRIRTRYARWVDWLFAHPPRQSRLSLRMMAMPGVDPYANIEVD